MQNKTPIMVLTGLAIVAAAAVAGLTRDHWMGEKPQVATTAPDTTEASQQPAAPEKPAEPAQQQAETKAPEQQQTAATAPASNEAPASTGQPSVETQPAASGEQTAAVQPEPSAQQPGVATQPETTAEQPVAAKQPEVPAGQPTATNATAAAKVPTFDTVRVEKTGDAVIAGTASAGADVVVMLDGKKIGQTTANGDGAFVVVPDKPLPAGSGALTIEAQAKGETAPTPSQQSVAVIVPAADQQQEPLVAVVSPDQPTKVLQKPEAKTEAPAATQAPSQTASETTTETAAAQPEAQAEASSSAAEKPAKLVSIDAVDYDPAGNIVFSGQGDNGNTARVYIDNKYIGDAPVGEDGRWTFSGTADVAQGVHTLRVDGIDSAGKVLNRVEVPFFREQQSKVAEASKPAETAGTAPASQPAQTTAPAAATTSTETAAQPAADQGTAPAAAGEATASQPAAAPAAGGDASTPAATPAKPQEGRVVIQPGNNLWRISRVLYGSGAKFTTLYEANKDQIRDPNRIYPGQVFKTPQVSPTSESIDPKRREPLKPEENAATGQ